MDDTSQLFSERDMVDRIRLFKRKILEATNSTDTLSVTTNEILAAIDKQQTEEAGNICL